MPSNLGGAPFGGDGGMAGGRRGASVKTLKRMLKKAGLKTSGRKAALTRRVKKAHLKMRGGVGMEGEQTKVAMALDAEPEFESGEGMPSKEPSVARSNEGSSGGRRRRRGSRKSRRSMY